MADVQLIDMVEADSELVRSWRTQPELNKYMQTNAAPTSEQQLAWTKKVLRDDTKRYWLIQFDQRKVGLINLDRINKDLGSAYWGFYVAEPQLRGKGIGAKAWFNVLEFVFFDLKLLKLNSEVLSNNLVSIQMHEKFGFRREGYFREHVKKGEDYYDLIALGMLRREWEAQRDFHYHRIYRIDNK